MTLGNGKEVVKVEGGQDTSSEPGFGHDLRVEVEDGVAVISLVGEHDIATAAALRSVILEQAALGHGVVMSVSEAEFIDSAIVHELFRGDREMMAVGRRLVLHLDAQAIVERVLQIGGVLGELIWTVWLPEAVAYAGQSSPSL
jgi:anti-anti-sigma factor